VFDEKFTALPEIFLDRFKKEVSYVYGHEPSGSLKYWGVPEWLHNWQLLRKSSPP
jgi:hypothetical protein